MNRFFSNRDLRVLIGPLLAEQVLVISVGMADTMMISYAGEAAISGIALVDLINVLLINIFAAIATGGAVVVSQYLGKGGGEHACAAAGQLLLVTALISLGVMALVLMFRQPLLQLLYGNVDREVMGNALNYLRISAYSYPFLAVFNSCAAASRAMAAVVLLFLLHRPDNLVSVKLKSLRAWDGAMVKRILYIGIPGGIENGLFQFGRVIVVGIIANFGAVEIAANAVANNLDNMGCIGGQAMNLAMVAVVARCVGARDFEQMKYYVKKLMKIAYILGTVTNGLVLITLPLVLKVYVLTPETASLAALLIWIHCGFGIFMWPAAFTLPNALRAANDVRVPMLLSVFSMAVFRVLFSVILGIYFGMGALGVWIAMLIDWLFRLTMFIVRYRQEKWRRMTLV